MSPVGQDQSNVTAPANTGGEFSGDTPGLFADAGDKPSCDAQTLAANLDADAAKATAWATALGLQSQDIPTYVGSLTPVVLRSDTAVTSYGYADGRFFAYPAVLQRGTAVFVNSYGEPKAKCFSGNPLTKPVSNPQANYVGPAWEQFAPTSVTIINRTTTVIKDYTCVDVRNGKTVKRSTRPQLQNDENGPCMKNPGSEQCQDRSSQLRGGAGGGAGGGGTGEVKCGEGQTAVDGKCVPKSGGAGGGGTGEVKCGEGHTAVEGKCVPKSGGAGGGGTGEVKCGEGQTAVEGKCVPKSGGAGGGGTGGEGEGEGEGEGGG